MSDGESEKEGGEWYMSMRVNMCEFVEIIFDVLECT